MLYLPNSVHNDEYNQCILTFVLVRYLQHNTRKEQHKLLEYLLFSSHFVLA